VILGLNAYHGDAAAAILVDGRLVAAAEEERFTRIKHTAGFPARDPSSAWSRFGSVPQTMARAVDADPASVRARFHYIEHHLAHVASAFFVSPFERAAVLSLDGLGDFASGMWGLGEGNRLHVWGSIPML